MILQKAKIFIMGGLALVATFFYAMWKRTEAGKAKMVAEAEKKKSEVEKLGAEAAFRGIEREKEVRNEHKNADHSKRNFFE